MERFLPKTQALIWVILCVSTLISRASGQCSNFDTVALAQAACTGTFREYPVNGTKVPYNCSTCGSGLICGGGVCPPVLTDRKVFNTSICPTPFKSTTNDFSCAALQKHCEDTGQGYLIFAKVFFFFPGSKYSCSNCSAGVVEMDAALTEADHPDGALEASYDSAVLILLYLASIILFGCGLVFEYNGRRQNFEHMTESQVILGQVNWQMKRLLLKIDSHGKNISFVQAVASQFFMFRVMFGSARCLEKCLCRLCGNDQDTRTPEEKAQDRRFDITYTIVALCLAISLATMLNGATRIFVTCELVYPGLSSFPPLLGIIELPTINPFDAGLLPNDTFTTYPEVVENVDDVQTIIDRLFFSGLPLAVAIEDLLIEELMLLGMLTGVETFTNGCEQMRHWNQQMIHNALRVSAVLYMVLAIGVHLMSFDGIDAAVAFVYIFTNLFFTFVLLSAFLFVIAFPRRILGNCLFGIDSQENDISQSRYGVKNY